MLSVIVWCVPTHNHYEKGPAMPTMTEPGRGVTLGIDTHADNHVGAVLDPLGRILATEEFTANTDGYEALLAWSSGFGPINAAGIEGTGSWGSGLARYLANQGVKCVEVNRPNRQHRRRHGKSDTADAVAAARAVQSEQATGLPRGHNGNAESLRMLRVADRSAVKARTQAINQLRSLISTGPEELTATLKPLTRKEIVATASSYRPACDRYDPVTTTKIAMRSLARRIQQLDTEVQQLRITRDALVEQSAPAELLDQPGIGNAVAADIIITIGDNPQRLASEQAFAALCGASPVDCSSGRSQRHRLNRGGDRQANNALWRIVMVRLACHQPTRDYMDRQLANGKTKREAIRQLKRYVARHIWRTLQQHPLTT